MAVAYFVVLPHKPADNELKEKVESKSGSLGVYYDLIFSNSKKPIGTQAVVVSDAAVIALTNENNADKAFETSLKDFMANDSRNVNVTLYNDENRFYQEYQHLHYQKMTVPQIWI